MKTSIFSAAGVFSVSVYFTLSLGAYTFASVRSDDSDLSGSAGSTVHLFGEVLRSGIVTPDLVESELQSNATPALKRGARFLSVFRGELRPVVGLRFGSLGVTDADGRLPSVPCAAGDAPLSAESGLEIPGRFAVESARNRTTQVQVELRCGEDLTFRWEGESAGAQSFAVWFVLTQALNKLQSEVGLEFWNAPIRVRFPSNGDYYQSGRVHLTRGDHWDVTSHELGHAIYDLANLGEFGGGSHKIDECYSQALALSEGWATFFAGWLFLDPKSADPHFEFLVPRREPLSIENVPADVCRGSSNEWRVSAFFWDLWDVHDDGEQVQIPFKTQWNALSGKGAGSAEQAAALLKRAGVSDKKIQSAWNTSF